MIESTPCFSLFFPLKQKHISFWISCLMSGLLHLVSRFSFFHTAVLCNTQNISLLTPFPSLYQMKLTKNMIQTLSFFVFHFLELVQKQAPGHSQFVVKWFIFSRMNQNSEKMNQQLIIWCLLTAFGQRAASKNAAEVLKTQTNVPGWASSLTWGRSWEEDRGSSSSSDGPSLSRSGCFHVLLQVLKDRSCVCFPVSLRAV